MDEKGTTPYLIWTEVENIVSEPTIVYGKTIGYQGTTINKAIADYYECNTNKEKISVLQWIVNFPGFQQLPRFSTNEAAVYGLNIRQYDEILITGEMPNNIAIAQKLVMNKFDVFLLSNPNSTKSADFILRKYNRLYYVEGKTLNGKNSLDHLIEKGCAQANRIVIDIVGISKTNYIIKEIKNAFESYPSLQEIFLLKGSRLIQITYKMSLAKTFVKNFKNVWNKNK